MRCSSPAPKWYKHNGLCAVKKYLLLGSVELCRHSIFIKVGKVWVRLPIDLGTFEGECCHRKGCKVPQQWVQATGLPQTPQLLSLSLYLCFCCDCCLICYSVGQMKGELYPSHGSLDIPQLPGTHVCTGHQQHYILLRQA